MKKGFRHTVAPEGGFQVDKGIEMPPRVFGDGGGRESIYPWKQMEKGDSFFVPWSAERAFGTHHSWNKKDQDKKFEARRRVEKVKGVDTDGFRVWRVK